MEQQLMVVKQLPVIEERLRSIKAEVEVKTKEAMSLVCTEDSYRDVKKARTELTKQFNTLEEQRKMVKKAVMAPYEAFEETYKECVTEPFKKADVDLKKKIDDVENGLKTDKLKAVTDYYNELLQAEGLEWIAERGYNPKVTMSVTLKALKDQAKELVFRYEDDISTIEALPDRDEIMVEYRKTLDASASIRAVSERHAALEEQRRMNEERQKREEAEKQAADAVHQAVAESAAGALGADPEAAQEQQNEKMGEAADFQPNPKTYTCKFYAKGSIAQLKGLKEYMERNGIEYGNL